MALGLLALLSWPGEANAADCRPPAAPPVRTELDLTVHEPPERPQHENHLRLRSQSRGSLSKGSKRTWIGPPVPSYVPLSHRGAELILMDHAQGETVGLYREMYGGASCKLGTDDNCQYYARAFDACGKPLFTVNLNQHLSRRKHLEIQDLRYADGILYFNEACQSYSWQAGGRCSALVAVNGKKNEKVWRSHHLVSNHRLVVHGDHIITGYGFTSERSRLHVVRRADGRVVHAKALTSPQIGLSVSGDELEVILYMGWKRQDYALRRWDTRAPQLALLRTRDRPKPR